VKEPDFTVFPPTLSNARVMIAGLGLMGGSLALALRERSGQLLGVDPDPGARLRAADLGLFVEVAARPEDLMLKPDVIILAAPVRASLRLIEALPGWHPGPALVLDICSTKVAIAHGLAGLPAEFMAFGGHPMCGREHGGITNADPALFLSAPFVFTALPNTSPEARIWAGRLAESLGSIPLWMEPEDHDRWVASTSHVPYLLACTLAAATPKEAAPLAASGYRSTARLAASSPAMMLDVLATNSTRIRVALSRLILTLREVEQYLEQPDLPALQGWLEAARAHHLALISESNGGTDLELAH
jgi:prephenate dehydrogenase